MSCSTYPTITQRKNVRLHSLISCVRLTLCGVPIRLAWFWVSNYITVMVSAFLATGILSLRSGDRAGWRYLFLIEGLITLAVGMSSYFLMPPGPTQTKAWFRPKGWFTEREEIIMVNRSGCQFYPHLTLMNCNVGFCEMTQLNQTCTIGRA